MGSPMTEKTRKAHQIDICEAQWVQSVGLVADYQRGRCVNTYNSCSTRDEIDRREEWVYKHMLTPTEQWGVRHGYIVNPFANRPNRKVERDAFKSAVYLADGRRKVFLTAGAAYAYFDTHNNAVKLWDGAEHKYILREEI